MENKIKEIQYFNYKDNNNNDIDKYNKKIINVHGYYTGSSNLDFNSFNINNDINNLYLYYCDYIKFNEPYYIMNDYYMENNKDLENNYKNYKYYTINNVYLHHCYLIIFNHINIKNLYLNNAFILNYDIQLLFYRFDNNKELFNQYCKNHQIEINNIYIKLLKSRISLYEGNYNDILNYNMIKNINYVEILINNSFIKIYNILKIKWNNNNDLIFYDLLHLFKYYDKEFDIDFVIVYFIIKYII